MRHLVATSLLVLVLGSTASAQTDKRDEALAAMEACRGISIAEVRLACMDAAGSILDEITSAPNENITKAPDNLEIERQRLDAERAALEVEREAIEKKRVELAELEETETKAKRRFSPLAPFTGDETPEEIAVTIVKITINKRDIHKFHTSDGDILTQTEVVQTLHPPSSLPAAATIKRSRVGSKWLVFDERPNRRLKVSLPRRSR